MEPSKSSQPSLSFSICSLTSRKSACRRTSSSRWSSTAVPPPSSIGEPTRGLGASPEQGPPLHHRCDEPAPPRCGHGGAGRLPPYHQPVWLRNNRATVDVSPSTPAGYLHI